MSNEPTTEVGNAERVENAGTVRNAMHVEHTDSIVNNPPPVERQWEHYVRLFIDGLRWLSTVLALLLCVYLFINGHSEAEAVRREFAAQASKVQAAQACYDLYSARVGVGTAEIAIAQADIFVQAASMTTADPEARRVLLAPFIDKLDAAKVVTRAAAADRDAYNAEHRPMPCPIKATP